MTVSAGSLYRMVVTGAACKEGSWSIGSLLPLQGMTNCFFIHSFKGEEINHGAAWLPHVPVTHVGCAAAATSCLPGNLNGPLQAVQRAPQGTLYRKQQPDLCIHTPTDLRIS